MPPLLHCMLCHDDDDNDLNNILIIVTITMMIIIISYLYSSYTCNKCKRKVTDHIIQLKYLDDLHNIIPCMKRLTYDSKMFCSHCMTTILFDTEESILDVYEYITNVSFYIFLLNIII